MRLQLLTHSILWEWMRRIIYLIIHLFVYLEKDGTHVFRSFYCDYVVHFSQICGI